MRNPEACSLLLLGDGLRRAVVEKTAAMAGVADRVFMPGKVADVRPLVAGALALVQASSREGLPRSMMEALALEVPLVATRARGQPELVGDDRGWLVDIGDVDAMAAAMDRILSHPAGAAAMGRRGRELILERYDLRLIIQEHERMYASLLAR